MTLHLKAMPVKALDCHYGTIRKPSLVHSPKSTFPNNVAFTEVSSGCLKLTILIYMALHRVLPAGQNTRCICIAG